MRPTIISLFLLAAGAVTLQAAPYVYPQKGQSQEQQQKDEYECYQWAKGQSGVDPSQPAPGSDRSGRVGGTVGGAARGAAGGALIGAIAGDAGKGAAIGAVGGGLLGRRGAINQEHSQAAARSNSYDRAYGACMEGRGYSVK